jgi:hypothetical protein
MLLADNVLDVEPPLEQGLRGQSIFATMTGSTANLRRDITHEFCCSDCLAFSCQ